ncbi:ScyD/ScyE family protein [Modestobacter sp. NPDC049651]|uniref:ScyD/ScyE family protein n=1 Tax=unclassified Modestobacter TaxID=2643866 RepID=UPI00340D3603
MRYRRTAAGAATATALVLAFPATASAHGGGDHAPVTTVASGLQGPRQLSDWYGSKLLVAESDSGEVSSVDRYSGEVHTLLTGLGSPQGVDSSRGKIYVAVGEAGGPPDSGTPAPPPGTPSAEVVEATPDGHVLRTWDLLQYEKDNNPDGQVQLVNGQPVDALSNPFGVLAQRHRVLVADAGANDVLSIDLRSGKISTFFVPPTVTDVAGCQNANPGTQGCDPVPTEITEGPDGLIYVGSLGAETPGAGRVYVLDQWGHVVRVIKGLTSVTGVAVDRRGNVYASNVVKGAPEGDGPPPAGFDPATVGEITRIDRWDNRSTAHVTMPSGLEYEDGALYASAWSIAGFVGLPNRGEVVRVDRSAFSG